jgi:tRNA threonylcarbamoyladenosine biosynthesis protein TsaE
VRSWSRRDRAVVEIVEFLSRSPGDTARLGARLAESLAAGDVVALTGVIGAGKSLLARAIAGGLGIQTAMASPSFVIVASYKGAAGGPDVNHIDLYRLSDYAEAAAAGVEEAIHSPAVSIVEWADHVPQVLPAERIDISLELGGEPDERLIALRPLGEDLGARLCEFMTGILREHFR